MKGSQALPPPHAALWRMRKLGLSFRLICDTLDRLRPWSSGASLLGAITSGREFHFLNDSQLSHFISEATGAQPASHASVSRAGDVSVTEVSWAAVFVCEGAGMFSTYAFFLLPFTSVISALVVNSVEEFSLPFHR